MYDIIGVENKKEDWYDSKHLTRSRGDVFHHSGQCRGVHGVDLSALPAVFRPQEVVDKKSKPRAGEQRADREIG